MDILFLCNFLFIYVGTGNKIAGTGNKMAGTEM